MARKDPRQGLSSAQRQPRHEIAVDTVWLDWNPDQALAEVQRDWLVKVRKERGLTEAVRLAGPFIMTSQGPVQ